MGRLPSHVAGARAEEEAGGALLEGVRDPAGRSRHREECRRGSRGIDRADARATSPASSSPLRARPPPRRCASPGRAGPPGIQRMPEPRDRFAPPSQPLGIPRQRRRRWEPRPADVAPPPARRQTVFGSANARTETATASASSGRGSRGRRVAIRAGDARNGSRWASACSAPQRSAATSSSDRRGPPSPSTSGAQAGVVQEPLRGVEPTGEPSQRLRMVTPRRAARGRSRRRAPRWYPVASVAARRSTPWHPRACGRPAPAPRAWRIIHSLKAARSCD
jgi:hypothetical protein